MSEFVDQQPVLLTKQGRRGMLVNHRGAFDLISGKESVPVEGGYVNARCGFFIEDKPCAAARFPGGRFVASRNPAERWLVHLTKHRNPKRHDLDLLIRPTMAKLLLVGDVKGAFAQIKEIVYAEGP